MGITAQGGISVSSGQGGLVWAATRPEMASKRRVGSFMVIVVVFTYWDVVAVSRVSVDLGLLVLDMFTVWLDIYKPMRPYAERPTVWSYSDRSGRIEVKAPWW